jgi:hypothetical protein
MQALPKLTPTQARLLRAAARRADSRVIPPDNLRGGIGARAGFPGMRGEQNRARTMALPGANSAKGASNSGSLTSRAGKFDVRANNAMATPLHPRMWATSMGHLDRAPDEKQKGLDESRPWRNPGGDEEDRTPDLRIANAALSQLSYVPMGLGL